MFTFTIPFHFLFHRSIPYSSPAIRDAPAEAILQKVAHEVNNLHASYKSVVDVSIDFHSKISSKSDKIFHMVGLIL